MPPQPLRLAGQPTKGARIGLTSLTLGIWEPTHPLILGFWGQRSSSQHSSMSQRSSDRPPAPALNDIRADGMLPANARQIMYAARPLVLALTDGKCWKDSNYFTQTLLPNYMFDYPSETANWDVVYDARGYFVEPHIRARLGLGTLDVRKYVSSWRDGNATKYLEIDIEELFPTKGQKHRYRFALFIEKEGFEPLLERSRISGFLEDLDIVRGQKGGIASVGPVART